MMVKAVNQIVSTFHIPMKQIVPFNMKQIPFKKQEEVVPKAA